MKVSKLTGSIAELDIKVPPPPDDPEAVEETVHVVYRPGALTLEISDKIRELQASGFEVDIMLEMFKRILVSWDLQNEDGSTLGVTEEDIKVVPLAFLGQLLGAIESDIRPNRPRDATSDGASQEDQRVPSLAGTSLEEQPDTGGSLLGTS